MSRICFIIMPFSATASCTEEEWTRIFEKVFKPAVEGAGLDYECRRSVAIRGNIVGAILQDLRDAYVVLADLTDRNANVFYELGVRHSLTDRSIILAQKQEDIPFDLHAYAYHVYDWKTREGCSELAEKLRQLLNDVDINPDRPDNPVSDFLGRITRPVQTQEPVTITRAETREALPLAGPGADGLDAAAFAKRLIAAGSPTVMNTVLRLTRSELESVLKTAMGTLNQRPAPGSVQEDQIPALALGYITTVEPNIHKVEEFILTCVEHDWLPGARMGVQLAGRLISLSERTQGRYLRFEKGLPALLAWRLLVLMGAKAMADDAFKSLEVVLREPVEVEHFGDRFSYLPFPYRRDLFHPETFLGHANHVLSYISGLWRDNLHLHALFGSEEEYHMAVGKFLMIVALVDAQREEGYPLYPGYRLLPQAERAMHSLCGKLATSNTYLSDVARALCESREEFQKAWSRRVARANSAELGSRYFPGDGAHFPDPMGATPPDS